jgi:hypothetical protein
MTDHRIGWSTHKLFRRISSCKRNQSDSKTTPIPDSLTSLAKCLAIIRALMAVGPIIINNQLYYLKPIL